METAAEATVFPRPASPVALAEQLGNDYYHARINWISECRLDDDLRMSSETGSVVRDYINGWVAKGCADRLSAAERFILEYGVPFDGAIRPAGRRKGRKKYCFKNAADLSGDNPNYQYAEGYAFSIEMRTPFLHAWCVRDGNAIEPTLEAPQNYQYLGIVIPNQLLWSELGTTYGVLQNDFGANLKFMRAWKQSHKKQFVAALPEA